MIDLGTVRPGSTIRIPWSSFDKDDGSSITATNYAAADILIYKDGSTTERASTAGFTATTDFDAKTGKHLAVIDLADNTTAGFYNAGSEYLVAIDAVTVDAVTTGGWIARFRIGYDGANLETTIASLSSQTSFTLTAGPAEDDALNGCVVCIHDIASAVQHGYAVVADYTGSTKTVTLTNGVTFTAAAGDNISFFPPGNARWFAALLAAKLPLAPTTAGRDLDVSAGGEAGIDWANIGSPTTAVNLSATNIDVDQVVASVSGAVASVTNTVNANVVQISGDTTAADNAESFFDGTGYAGTNNVIPLVTTTTNLTNKGDGSGFTAIPWNAAWDAEVQSEVQDAIEVNHLDHLLAATYDPASKPGAADALLNELVENDGGVARYTANALEQAPSGGGGVADWTADERTAIRAILGIPGSGTTPEDPTTGILGTIRDKVDAVDDFLDTEIAAILADTNELQTDWANGGRLDNILDARSSQTSVDDLPTNAELATALGTADDAILAVLGTPAGASVSADIAAVKADSAAIKTKTDSLTFTQAGHVDANIQRINDVIITGNGQVGTEFNV